MSWAYAPGYVSWCPLGWNNYPVAQFGYRGGYAAVLQPVERVDGGAAPRLRPRRRPRQRRQCDAGSTCARATRSSSATRRRIIAVTRCRGRKRRFARPSAGRARSATARPSAATRAAASVAAAPAAGADAAATFRSRRSGAGSLQGPGYPEPARAPQAVPRNAGVPVPDRSGTASRSRTGEVSAPAMSRTPSTAVPTRESSASRSRVSDVAQPAAPSQAERRARSAFGAAHRPRPRPRRPSPTADLSAFGRRTREYRGRGGSASVAAAGKRSRERLSASRAARRTTRQQRLRTAPSSPRRRRPARRSGRPRTVARRRGYRVPRGRIARRRAPRRGRPTLARSRAFTRRPNDRRRRHRRALARARVRAAAAGRRRPAGRAAAAATEIVRDLWPDTRHRSVAPASSSCSCSRQFSAPPPACSSPTPTTCRKSPPSTTTRRAPSRASTAPAASRRRVRDRAPRDHSLRGHLAQARAGDPRRRGPRVLPAHRPQHPAHRRHAGQGHRRAPPARRQHADAAARPQAVPHRRQDLGAEDPRGDPRDPDREALHEAGDLHALLQPDVFRPRRLRRRSRRAPLLRQIGEGRHARGSRHDRRDPAGQRPAEPVRQPGRGDAAAELHAGADGRRRLHHRGGGRGRQEEADRDAAGPAGTVAVRRPVLPRGSQAASSRAATARSSSTRTASRFRRRSI